jgi:hypothetical protein
MGGAWEDPNNWTDENGYHRTPEGSQDDAYILGLDPGASVTVISIAACRTLHTDQFSPVEIDGGHLTLNPTIPSELDGPIVLDGGALWMGSGTIVSNSFAWLGGTLGLGNNEKVNGPVNFTEPIQIDGSDEKFVAEGSLVNTAGITQTGTGKLNLYYQTLMNKATYDLESDADIQSGRIQNDGVFQKTAGTGTSTISSEFDNSASGQINVASGTVQLSHVGTWTGAALSVAPDCHLLLDGTGPTFLSGEIGGTGGGEVRFESGVFNVDTMGAVFGFDPSMLNWTGGNFSGPGILTLGTGTTLTLSGDDPKEIGGVVAFGYIRNLGTIIQTGAGNLFNEGTLENTASGTYDLQSDAGLTSSGFFTNAGTLRKSNGTGTSNVSNQFFNEGGSIEVQAGTLSLLLFSASTGGNFTAASRTAIELMGTSDPLTGTYTGSGEGQVRFEDTLMIGSGGATFNFDPGLFQWVSGTINAANDLFTNNGTITLIGDDTKFGLGYFLNNGAIIQTGGGSFYVQSMINMAAGTYDLQSAGGISGGSFTNFGTFRASTPSSIVCNFTNAMGGTLDVVSTLSLTEGLTNDGGTVRVEDNGSLKVIGTYTQTAGYTTLNQVRIDAVPLLNADTVDLQGGILQGIGLIGSNVRNAAQVTPGGNLFAGLLSILGNYTETDTGTLLIELGGFAAGTNYSQLEISGQASLAGTLQVSLINGFTPNVGDTFQILTFGSSTGPGPLVQLPDLGDTMHLDIQPNDTSFNLVTVGDPSSPPPGSRPPGSGPGESSGTQPSTTFTTQPERLRLQEALAAGQRDWTVNACIDAFFHHWGIASDNSEGSSGSRLGRIDRLAEGVDEAVLLSDVTRLA